MAETISHYAIYDHPRDFPDHFVVRKTTDQEVENSPVSHIINCVSSLKHI
jgi:hypothetical protein